MASNKTKPRTPTANGVMNIWHGKTSQKNENIKPPQKKVWGKITKNNDDTDCQRG